MLCIRDPADETNDLGRKGIAIKHVQATFRNLCYNLNRDLAFNTRPSQLGRLVGTSYMLNKERRTSLRRYGNRLSLQLQPRLAATAKMVIKREQETEEAKLTEEANTESEENKEKMRSAREERDKEFHRLAEVRNAKLRQEAERTAVLEHGDAMASILGMPSVADEASEQNSNDAEGPMVLQTQVEEANSESLEGSKHAVSPRGDQRGGEGRSIESTAESTSNSVMAS
jgi:non-canonical poly(A) RNA polymerase PAPD5/7